MGTRWTSNALSAAAMCAAMTTSGCLGAPVTETGRNEAAAPSPATEPAPPAGRAIVGPFSHGNLSVFLITDDSIEDEREFITLDEGLTAGTVLVNERGATQGRDNARVNTVEISNRSGKWLYIEAGEVVKGGKQDRTLGRDAVLAPGTNNQPLAAFCVERGRWSAGGGHATPCPTPSTSTYTYTPTTYFPTYYPTAPTGPSVPATPSTPTTAPTAPAAPTGPSGPAGPTAPGSGPAGPTSVPTGPTSPSAPTAPSGSPAPWPTPVRGTNPTGPAAPGMRFTAARAALSPSMKVAILKEKNQGKVWASVAKQRSAWGAQSSSSGTWMDVARSKKVDAKTAPYLKALKPHIDARRGVVGIVFVRSGAIVGADEYGAPGLFQRLYPKLLAAHAREAALVKRKFKGKLPDRARVEAFLGEAELGDEKRETTVEGQSLRTCESDRAITFDAREGDKLMHRTILSKTACEDGK